MSYSSTLHDEINLKRLVQRLEKTTLDDWDELPRDRSWIKALGMLQKIKFARKLLKTVDLSEDHQTPTRAQQLEDIRIQLDKIESFIKDVEHRTAPEPPQPAPILPTIPRPKPLPSTLELPSGESSDPIEGAEVSDRVKTDELLLPAETPAYSSSISASFPKPMTLIPETLSSSTAANDRDPIAITTGVAPRFLQNSTLLQQELSDQLAQMATQLKRNALHFSDSLSRDQSIVEETKEKLESNFDIMQKERIRLRDHRGKSGSTTCLVVLIIITVLLLFMFMVSIIRFT